MKKFSFFLIILLLTRIGTSFADTTTSSQAQIQNFFLGNSVSNNGNLNQVLALLVGPQGKPGVAGVAGKDGFIGLNGKDGVNGLDGAPGAVGPQGPAGVAGEQGPAGPVVAVVLVSSGDTSCPAGGTKFVTADGKSSYACNGLAGSGGSGPAGPAGANGNSVRSTPIDANPSNDNCLQGGSKFEVINPEGTVLSTTYACNGGGGEAGVQLGAGKVTVGSCNADSVITVNLIDHYSGEDFFIDAVKLKGLLPACSTKTMIIHIKPDSESNTAAIPCSYTLPEHLSATTEYFFILPEGKAPNDPAISLEGTCEGRVTAFNSRLIGSNIGLEIL